MHHILSDFKYGFGPLKKQSAAETCTAERCIVVYVDFTITDIPHCEEQVTLTFLKVGYT